MKCEREAKKYTNQARAGRGALNSLSWHAPLYIIFIRHCFSAQNNKQQGRENGAHLTSPRRMHGEQATLAKKAKNWDGCIRWASQRDGPNTPLRSSAQSFGRRVPIAIAEA